MRSPKFIPFLWDPSCEIVKPATGEKTNVVHVFSSTFNILPDEYVPQFFRFWAIEGFLRRCYQFRTGYLSYGKVCVGREGGRGEMTRSLHKESHLFVRCLRYQHITPEITVFSEWLHAPRGRVEAKNKGQQQKG